MDDGTNNGLSVSVFFYFIYCCLIFGQDSP